LTYEEFKVRNQNISIALEAITERTANMAWGNSASTNNPEFRVLMERQEQLLAAAEKLLEQLEKGD